MEVSKTYKLGDLWQRHTERITSTANTPDDLASPGKSGPISRDESTTSLSDIPRGSEPPLSEEEIKKDLRVDGLKDLSRLLKVVSEQEKKYGYRLSPHSNFFCRHLMVQQFLQLQLKIQSSPTRRTLSIQVAQAFGRGESTGRSIVRWEISWIEKREIPDRSERSDSDSWMYDVDVGDAI